MTQRPGGCLTDIAFQLLQLLKETPIAMAVVDQALSCFWSLVEEWTVWTVFALL